MKIIKKRDDWVDSDSLLFLKKLPSYVIPWFNDTHTHAECLALLDDAIEATTPVIQDLPAAIKYIFRPETMAA